MAKKSNKLLLPFYDETRKYELGIDESGRGVLFGRVYIGAVILPKQHFRFELMKDSKKFSNRQTRDNVAKYIMENAVAWHVAYVDEKEIDVLNILQATMKGMNECIEKCFQQIAEPFTSLDVQVLIDGSYFVNQHDIVFQLFKGGDDTYCSIAAASILAKTLHDQYIRDLCHSHPLLDIRYGLLSNMGYGTKKHLEGIKEHGISQFHRKHFGVLCKNAVENIV